MSRQCLSLFCYFFILQTIKLPALDIDEKLASSIQLGQETLKNLEENSIPKVKGKVEKYQADLKTAINELANAKTDSEINAAKNKVDELNRKLGSDKEDEESGELGRLKRLNQQAAEQQKALAKQMGELSKRKNEITSETTTATRNAEVAKAKVDSAKREFDSLVKKKEGLQDSFDPSKNPERWDQALTRLGNDPEFRDAQSKLSSALEAQHSAESRLTKLETQANTLAKPFNETVANEFTSAWNNTKEAATDLWKGKWDSFKANAGEAMTDVGQGMAAAGDGIPLNQQSIRASDVLAGKTDPLASEFGVGTITKSDSFPQQSSMINKLDLSRPADVPPGQQFGAFYDKYGNVWGVQGDVNRYATDLQYRQSVWDQGLVRPMSTGQGGSGTSWLQPTTTASGLSTTQIAMSTGKNNVTGTFVGSSNGSNYYWNSNVGLIKVPEKTGSTGVIVNQSIWDPNMAVSFSRGVGNPSQSNQLVTQSEMLKACRDPRAIASCK